MNRKALVVNVGIVAEGFLIFLGMIGVSVTVVCIGQALFYGANK